MRMRVRFVVDTVTDIERVCVIVLLVLRDTDIVYVSDTVIDLVNGCVVGMPVTERVPQGEGDTVRVTERVRDTDTDLVNGWVVAIPDTESVPDVLAVGKEEAPTVGIEGGDGVTVIERLYVKDDEPERVMVTDTVKLEDTVTDLV